MQFSKTILSSLLLTVFVIVVLCGTTFAQSIWLSPNPEPGISLEILKPKLETDRYIETDFISSLWFLSARLPLNQNHHLLVELPVSTFKGSVRNWDYYWNGGPEYREVGGETAIGNPFFGFEIQDRKGTWYSLFGVRLPLIGEKNSHAKEQAVITDVDRGEAFLDDLTPITIRFGYRSPKKDGIALHAYAGPTIWLLGGDNTANDNEILLDYGAQVWVRSEFARMGAGITGRYWLTLDNADFDESTVHQFGFAANIGDGRIRPGVHLRLPLDEDWDFTGVEYIYGVNLTLLL